MTPSTLFILISIQFSISHVGTAAAKSVSVISSGLICSGSLPDDWPTAWDEVSFSRQNYHESPQNLCDGQSPMIVNAGCICIGSSVICGGNPANLADFCKANCRCPSDGNESGAQNTSAQTFSGAQFIPAQTWKKTCGGSCTKLHGCSDTCVCIATPKPARPMEYLSNCLRQMTLMSTNPKLRRDDDDPEEQSDNTDNSGEDAAVSAFVVEVAPSNASSSVFEDSNGVPMACPCNTSYVSYACCKSDDGIVFEPASEKLGTLDLTASD